MENKNISLARALKEKAKLVGNITMLELRLETNNSHNKLNTPDYNAAEVLNELVAAKKSLVALKTKIATANAPIAGHIFEMAELKGLVSTLRGLNTTQGTHSAGRYGREEVAEFSATISRKKADEEITKLEGRIQDIQEILDTHNATVKITVDIAKIVV
jgi:hypothetical protein